MPGLVHFFNNKTFRRNRGRLQKHRDFLHAMDAKVIVVAEQGHSIQGIMTAPVFLMRNQFFSDEEWQKTS